MSVCRTGICGCCSVLVGSGCFGRRVGCRGEVGDAGSNIGYSLRRIGCPAVLSIELSSEGGGKGFEELLGAPLIQREGLRKDALERAQRFCGLHCPGVPRGKQRSRSIRGQLIVSCLCVDISSGSSAAWLMIVSQAVCGICCCRQIRVIMAR